MIKININDSFIPIPFVDKEGKELFKLKFYKTDENLQRILDYNMNSEELKKEDSGDIAKQKVQVKEIVDSTLGEGSFDQMYNIDKSLFNVVDYYTEIVIAILEDMGYEEAGESLEKYRLG